MPAQKIKKENEAHYF